jgi:uncharacterized membrane protein YdfJ with MMPL/SSD domain
MQSSDDLAMLSLVEFVWFSGIRQELHDVAFVLAFRGLLHVGPDLNELTS